MGRAKTEKFPMFAGFSLDPKTNKMSAGYIIGISIKPADFGLTGSEDNATMATAVVKSLEAQGAAEATARAEAAEQRAEAAEREVARLRAGWADAVAEVAAMGAEPNTTGQVLTERRSPATRAALREVARMLAEAQPAEVSDV
jgi:hypothetical protein